MGIGTSWAMHIPAAWCGTVGLKIAVDQVSRADVCPLRRIFDSVLNDDSGLQRRCTRTRRPKRSDYADPDGPLPPGLRPGAPEAPAEALPTWQVACALGGPNTSIGLQSERLANEDEQEDMETSR
jgi:hypothetical protein